MRVLMYSLDKQFFEPGGDARNRMIEYGKLVERLDIIAFTPLEKIPNNTITTRSSWKFLTGRAKEKFKPEQIAENVWIYPTNSWHKLFYICDGIRLGKKIIKENNCNLVITQEPYITGLAGYCLVKRSKIKLLVSVYGNNIFDPHWLAEAPRHRLFKFIGQRVFKRADAIQTDGDETVEELKKRYGEKVFWKPIIPSNIEDFKTEKEKTSLPIKILFVGRLVRQKNLPLLMEVLEQLSKTAATGNVAVTIIGDGPLKDYLLTEIEKRKLNKLITYIPRASRSEILNIFKEHHILVLTSIYEGFAKVFMEAAAAGLPIVTTQVSGVANIIKDSESGYVLPQNDANGIVEKLTELIDNPELLKSFSQKIRADFTVNYSLQTTIEEQKKIFNFLYELGNG